MTKQTNKTSKQFLIDHLAKGFTINYSPQGECPNIPMRESAVLILFSDVGNGLEVLLTRRSPKMRYHPGQIAFPGGGMEEQDKNHIATALRETEEEIGLNPKFIEVLGTLPKVHVTASNNLVTPIVGWYDPKLTINLLADFTETLEILHVPLSKLIEPVNRGISVKTVSNKTYYSNAFKLNEDFGNYIIWGFTSIVLSDMIEQLGISEIWNTDTKFHIQ